MNRFFRSALFPLIVIVLLVYLASQTLMRESPKEKVTYSQLQQLVQDRPEQFKEIVANPTKQELSVELNAAAGKENGEKYKVAYPSPESLVNFEKLMESKNVNFDSKAVGGSPWWSLLTSLLPFVLLFGFWIFLMNQVQGGGSKVMSFGKSRAKRMTPDSPKIGFKDVAGVDEAVEELHEIKEFLENPK
jgi:cell division protease FtsH